jgi:hypothetical protein
MNASRNRLGGIASLGDVNSRPSYPIRFPQTPHELHVETAHIDSDTVTRDLCPWDWRNLDE